MKLLNKLLDLIFVPVCVSCGDRLSTGFLCDECRDVFEKRRRRACPHCYHRYSECTCVSAPLRSVGVKTHLKLFSYEPLSPTMPESKMIYTMKRQNNRPLADFLSGELAALALPYIKDKNAIISYMPRSRNAVVEHGVDQSEILAKGVARKLHLPFMSLLKRHGAHVQKALNKKERFQNARRAYSFKKRQSLSGETVILIDDISTSGATLAAGADLLRKNGAGEIILLTLAVVSNASYSNIN